MCSAISSCFLGPAFGGCHLNNNNCVHVRLKLQYLPEVELSSTEPEARRSDGRNDRRSLGGCSGSLGIDEFPRSAIPAAADDCAMRGLATAALSGGWARPLLPFLAVGPAFWIAFGGAWLPAACPRLSTMPLSGCCSFRPLPEEFVCGLGLVARREGTALRRGALWKAGVRACRRWAPPSPLPWCAHQLPSVRGA